MSSSCPNINLPEWKTLVKAVGQLEAYRDFMETGGQIRTPKEVNAKLLERASEPKEAVNRLRLENPSFQDVIYATSNQKDADGTKWVAGYSENQLKERPLRLTSDTTVTGKGMTDLKGSTIILSTTTNEKARTYTGADPS